MIGLILAGHGEFSQGFMSTMKMLIGPQEYMEQVQFSEDCTLEELQVRFAKSIEVLRDCTDIIVLSDILGGSPYKCALEFANKNEKIHVIAGTNIGMACEAALTRYSCDNVSTFIESLIEAGKNSIIYTNTGAFKPCLNEDENTEL